MNNEIELRMQEDDFDGVHNMIPGILEDIVGKAEFFLDSDIVCFSSSIISLLCIFRRTVDSFEFYSDEYEGISARYNSVIQKTRSAIIAEQGSDHPYLEFLDKLRWERLAP